jgi:hypothetical protein
MTLARWTSTLIVFGVSLGLHWYCLLYVKNAWGLMSLFFLYMMAFRTLVDTVDLCCGRLIRGESRVPAVRQVATVRRIILEEIDLYEETTFGTVPVGQAFYWSTQPEPGEVWPRRKVADGLYRRPAQGGHRALVTESGAEQVVYLRRHDVGKEG